MLEYLSPTSIQDFLKDRKEFYLQRLAEARPPRFPQTQPMSIGSAFDAYVKSYLHEILYGKGFDPKFELETLFTTQVEPHNRDWARVHGPVAFEYYKNSGALVDLLMDLKRAKGTIHFESEIRGDVGGVTLLGKPDCYYINRLDHPVILDWKVNGWCGGSNTSPKPGYVRCRGCDVNGNASITHKNAVIDDRGGVRLNVGTTLDVVEKTWAAQLSIYSWLYGEPVGGEFICAIDQIACDGSKGGAFPICRVAEHRLLCNSKFQTELLSQAQYIWGVLKSGHIFDDLPRDESDAMCASLEESATLYRDNPVFGSMVRTRKW